jgi:hypothetical protein
MMRPPQYSILLRTKQIDKAWNGKFWARFTCLKTDTKFAPVSLDQQGT